MLVRLQRLLAPEPAALFRLLNRPPSWIADADVHRMHFHVRDGATGGSRAMDKYLGRLDDIRRIQTYLSGRARREGVTVVENANVERSIDTVMGLVMDAAERVREAV